MKKFYRPLVLVLTVLFLGCEDDIYAPSGIIVKACVDAKITEFETHDICSKSGDVKEYIFQGKQVYVFNPGDCGADLSSEVIDSDCNSLGTLGGITGNTKINDEEFSNAKYIQTVWRKDNNNQTAIQEDERLKIESKYQDILNVLSKHDCTNSDDWTFMAIGSKACGGPEGYIAFPQSIAQSIVPQIEEYTEERKAFDKRWGIMSNCAYEVPPTKVVCNNGKSELVY